MQLGRITGLDEPTFVSVNADQYEVRGFYTASSAANGQIVRQQIVGLADNPDEPTIPVVSAQEPALSGFYQVLGADVPIPPEGNANGHFAYTLHLRRVPGGSTALVESTMLGALMVNDFGVVAGSTEPWHAVGFPVYEYQASGTYRIDRTGESRTQFVTLDGAYGQVIKYAVSPSNYYAGSARIDVGTAQTSGDPLAPIWTATGRNVSLPPGTWRVTNGLVQIEATGNNGPSGLNFRFHTGTAYSSALRTFNVNLNGSTLGQFSDARILRNSPEEVSIRLTGTGYYGGTVRPGSPYSYGYTDITLRRGSRLATVYVVLGATLASGVADFGFGVTTSAITGGLVSTAADTDTIKYVVASSKTFGQHGGTGDLEFNCLTNPHATFDLGVGYTVGTPATYDTAQDLAYQYLAAQSERARVVIR